MPLIKGKSRKAFQENVKTEMHAGKPQKQSLAIAYAVQRKHKKSHGGEIKHESHMEEHHAAPKLEQQHHHEEKPMAHGGHVEHKKMKKHEMLKQKYDKDYTIPHASGEPDAANEMMAKGGEAKLGSGKRFAKLEHSIAEKSDVRDPAAVAAAIGRKKYGAKKFSALSHHKKMAEGGEVDTADNQDPDSLEMLEGEHEMSHHYDGPNEGEMASEDHADLYGEHMLEDKDHPRSHLDTPPGKFAEGGMAGRESYRQDNMEEPSLYGEDMLEGEHHAEAHLDDPRYESDELGIDEAQGREYIHERHPMKDRLDSPPNKYAHGGKIGSYSQDNMEPESLAGEEMLHQHATDENDPDNEAAIGGESEDYASLADAVMKRRERKKFYQGGKVHKEDAGQDMYDAKEPENLFLQKNDDVFEDDIADSIRPLSTPEDGEHGHEQEDDYDKDVVDKIMSRRKKRRSGGMLD